MCQERRHGQIQLGHRRGRTHGRRLWRKMAKAPKSSRIPGPYGAEHRVRTGRPSPWQGEQRKSSAVPAPYQRSPIIEVPSDDEWAADGSTHQPSSSVHSRFVPQVFQDGARPLDVAQVAVLLGWTRDAVRTACDRGKLVYGRDHLNAYRIPCSALASTKGWSVRNEGPGGAPKS